MYYKNISRKIDILKYLDKIENKNTLTCISF